MSEELKRINKLLNENFVPTDVWIGNNSTADRVEWVLKRKKAKEQLAAKRFDMFADEFLVLAVIDNFEKEDLTVAEIAKRSGLAPEKVQQVAQYLAEKGVVFRYNDGFQGDLYSIEFPDETNSYELAGCNLCQ